MKPRVFSIAAFTLVAGIVAGIVASEGNRPGGSAFSNLGFNWLPGIVFGAAFALGIDGSVSDVVSFSSVSALIYFGAVQFYALRTGINQAFITGFGGAMLIALSTQFLLKLPVRRIGGLITSLIGGFAGIPFVVLVGKAATPPNNGMSYLRMIEAYVLWQFSVAITLAFSLDASRPAKFREVEGWRWAIDAIGIIGSIASIVSLFH